MQYAYGKKFFWLSAAAPHEMFSFISAESMVVACGNLFSDMKNVQHTQRGEERDAEREREIERRKTVAKV